MSPREGDGGRLQEKESRGANTPLRINGTLVERVSSYKSAELCISEDVSWTTHHHPGEEGEAMSAPPQTAVKVLLSCGKRNREAGKGSFSATVAHRLRNLICHRQDFAT